MGTDFVSSLAVSFGNSGLAAATAAEVDRVVIGVHRSIGDDARSRIRVALDASGLASSAYWVDLAPFMMEGRLTDELVVTRFRYAVEEAAGAIATLRERSLIDDAGRPAPELEYVIEEVESVRLAAAAQLWGSSTHLEALAAEAAVMLRRARGPLVEPFRALNEPDDEVGLLWHRLIGLRCWRADAHAAAWLAAGLSPLAVECLTAAWHEGTVAAPEPSLIARGAVTDSGMITDLGRSLRDSIEADTNDRSEPAYACLGDARWAGWLAAMAELPPQPQP